MREGWQPDDDWLPERGLTERLSTGVGTGVGLSPNELREMIGGYYRARQWVEEGRVPEWKVQALGITPGQGARVGSPPPTPQAATHSRRF